MNCRNSFATVIGLGIVLLLSTVATSQIYYVGDQSTAKDNNGTGSFHDALNWLNFRSPGGIIAGTDENDDADGIDIPGNGLAHFDIETDHRPNNFGRKPPGGDYYGLPNYLYFGDFLDRRIINNDKLVPGGTARPSGVTIASGDYTFDFGSNIGQMNGALITSLLQVINYEVDPIVDPSLRMTGAGAIETVIGYVGSTSQSGDSAAANNAATLSVEGGVQWRNSYAVGVWGDGSTLVVEDGSSLETAELNVNRGGEVRVSGMNSKATVESRLAISSASVVVDSDASIELPMGLLMNDGGLVRLDDAQLVAGDNIHLNPNTIGPGPDAVIEITNFGRLSAPALSIGNSFAEGRAAVVNIKDEGELNLVDLGLRPNGKVLISDHGQVNLNSSQGGLDGQVEIVRDGRIRIVGDSAVSGIIAGSFSVLAAGKMEVVGIGELQVLGGRLEVEGTHSEVSLQSGLLYVSSFFEDPEPGKLSLVQDAKVTSAFQASFGNAEVTISDGAVLSTSIGVPGNSSYSPSDTAGIVGRDAADVARVRIEGSDSLWENVDGFLTVGFRGDGLLELANGGQAKSIGGQIGRTDTAHGVVTVRGGGSKWEVAENLYVGGSNTASGGTGRLLVEELGVVEIESELRVWEEGLVEVGASGVVVVGEVSTSPSLGSVTVGVGGILSGSGNIEGDVVLSGGVLAPGASPGILKIDGDLSLSPESVLRLELSGVADGLYDQLQVTGDLSILGTIEFLLVDGFRPKISDTFRFLKVSGSLDITDASFATPHGLSIRAIGPGVFQVVAVPEPQWLALIGFSWCLVGLRRSVRV